MFLDAVLTRADRVDVEENLLRVTVFPEVLRDDGLTADGEGDVAVGVVLGEGELHPVAVQHFDALDHGESIGKAGPALLELEIKGEFDVFGRDWRAVGPARFVAQLVDDPRAVLRHLDGLGEDTVRGVEFVRDPTQHAVVEQAQTSSIVAPAVEVVEVVEAADDGGDVFAVNRRVRVQVGVALHVGGVSGLAIKFVDEVLDRCVHVIFGRCHTGGQQQQRGAGSDFSKVVGHGLSPS
ncbi:MAG: Uncharacterised protein [Rhodospirillaceae bacterium]|nr:MAG: Uncharacterised protein [Rhodospirillaceae bacterium]